MKYYIDRITMPILNMQRIKKIRFYMGFVILLSGVLISIEKLFF